MVRLVIKQHHSRVVLVVDRIMVGLVIRVLLVGDMVRVVIQMVRVSRRLKAIAMIFGRVPIVAHVRRYNLLAHVVKLQRRLVRLLTKASVVAYSMRVSVATALVAARVPFAVPVITGARVNACIIQLVALAMTVVRHRNVFLLLAQVVVR
jgi:hypothetical protein